jgi:hypothetical protein
MELTEWAAERGAFFIGGESPFVAVVFRLLHIRPVNTSFAVLPLSLVCGILFWFLQWSFGGA